MCHRILCSRLFRAGTAGLLACVWLACLNPRPEEWPSNAAGTDDTSTSGPQGDLNDGASGSTATSGEGGGAGSVPVVSGSAGTSSEGPGDAGPADAAPDAASDHSLNRPPSDAGISDEEPRD